MSKSCKINHPCVLDSTLTHGFIGFKGLIVASSGLKNEVKTIASIINATGGTYIEILERNASVLIINPKDADYQKPIYAKKRRIPVVTLNWLLQSLALDRPQAYAAYDIPDSLWQQYKHAEGKEMAQTVEHDENAAKLPPKAVGQVKR